MRVELVAMTQPINPYVPNMGRKNPLEVVEKCAAVCYDSQPTKEYKIAKKCAESHHWSVWESISFTFHVSEVSRALLAQLSRHRHISLSVRSTRYTNEKNFSYYIPKDIDEDSYKKLMDELNDYYVKSVDSGTPKEQARMILPLSLYTELYMTVNARALIEISNKRLCNRAEPEIRTLFLMIKDILKDYCPEMTKYLVSSCETHNPPYCPEGKPCGKYPKLKQIIGEYNEKIYQLEKENEELYDDLQRKEIMEGEMIEQEREDKAML